MLVWKKLKERQTIFVVRDVVRQTTFPIRSKTSRKPTSVVDGLKPTESVAMSAVFKTYFISVIFPCIRAVHFAYDHVSPYIFISLFSNET